MKINPNEAWVVADKYTNEAHTITSTLDDAETTCFVENERTGYEKFWVRRFDMWLSDVVWEARREGECSVGWT